MKIKRPILYFRGINKFLSNFYLCDVPRDGLIYPSAEHAFQAAKVLDFETKLMFSELTTPALAKKIGRKVPLRSDWNEVRIAEMYDVVMSKFNHNEDLRKKLLGTGDEIIIEGNTWHDNFWGKCFCKKCEHITGENNLGKILERVRAELRDVKTESPICY